MKVTESSLRQTPTTDQLRLYAVDVEYPIDKARRCMGYDPRVGLDQGLDWSVSWLRQNGLVVEE
jgi:nucleoside-diphosphate-sugar epimerase